jgi:hypothetical protein
VITPKITRAVWKVRGLALLLWVGTLRRCGDGLFFEVPPLASDALLTTLHPLLENVLQTVDHLEISSLGAPFPWLEKSRNRMGRDLIWILCSAWKKWIGGTPLEHPPYSPDLAPCNFWAFPSMKRELRGKKFRRYFEKRDRHRTSTKFRLGVIRWVHELFKRPSYISRNTNRTACDFSLFHIACSALQHSV